MTDYSFIRTTPFVLKENLEDLEQILDEVFIDLEDSRDTQLLSVSCYEQAVADCIVMGDNCFLLKVRPDLRGLLLSELGKDCKVFRVFRYAGRPETRLLLTGELSVQFSEGTSREKRRSYLDRYFTDAAAEKDLAEGTYRLKETFLKDPLMIARSLKRDPALAEVAPLAFTFPARALRSF